MAGVGPNKESMVINSLGNNSVAKYLLSDLIWMDRCTSRKWVDSGDEKSKKTRRAKEIFKSSKLLIAIISPTHMIGVNTMAKILMFKMIGECCCSVDAVISYRRLFCEWNDLIKSLISSHQPQNSNNIIEADISNPSKRNGRFKIS